MQATAWLPGRSCKAMCAYEQPACRDVRIRRRWQWVVTAAVHTFRRCQRTRRSRRRQCGPPARRRPPRSTRSANSTGTLRSLALSVQTSYAEQSQAGRSRKDDVQHFGLIYEAQPGALIIACKQVTACGSGTCFCGWMPSTSRRSQAVSCVTCTPCSGHQVGIGASAQSSRRASAENAQVIPAALWR